MRHELRKWEGIAQEGGTELREAEPVTRKGHFKLGELLRRFVRPALGLSLLLTAGEAGCAVRAQPDAVHAAETAEQEQRKPVGVADVRRTVETSTEERMYVCADVHLSVCYPVGDGAEKTASYTLEDVLAVARQNGWKTVVVAHTHNLHDYGEAGVPHAAQSYEQNGVSREAIPPSAVDLLSNRQAVAAMGAEGIRLVEAVAGTTGVWEYELQNGLWSRTMEHYELALKEVQQLVDESTGPEAEQVAEVMNNRANTLNYIAALDALAGSNALAKTIAAKLRGDTKPGQDFEQLVTEFEWRQMALGVLPENSDPAVLQAARRSFISYATSLGIRMQFTPYSQEKK